MKRNVMTALMAAVAILSMSAATASAFSIRDLVIQQLVAETEKAAARLGEEPAEAPTEVEDPGVDFDSDLGGRK